MVSGYLSARGAGGDLLKFPILSARMLPLEGLGCVVMLVDIPIVCSPQRGRSC